MADYEHILIDDPRPKVRRITLNRPEKRNALSNPLRAELFHAVEAADRAEAVHVTVICGAGSCFSSGYDLSVSGAEGMPFPTAMGDGYWPRHVVEGAFRIWDLAKPVIAQVHGYCLAGGSELMASCDLVYVGESAQIGYPPVRLMSPPDNQFHPWMAGMRNAMELMLTGDAVDGPEAVRMGLANRCFADDDLEREVLDRAERIAKIPPDLQQLNKRTVHRAMEVMGMRAAIRAGTEIQALAFHQPSARAYLRKVADDLNAALDERDGTFGDYRTEGEE
ncbi:MAG: enoyl-CoA hydratase-related protein [Acidimicrobiales bacterium]